jgi:Holliday junction resolvase
MPSRAKAKGNAWEREVAKHLSEIFNENFMRVPNSGAYTGGANIFRVSDLTESQKRMMDGDIIVPESISNWKFECKNYKELDFHGFFTESRQLDKWIKQAESNTLWFLIVKITRKCKFICFNEKISSNFTFSNYTRYKDYILVEYDSFFENNFQKMRELNENQL